MNKNNIREPLQKRSIEKKEKIIKAGFKLICKKGYYNTNTAEIAKEAGVSTGIIYQYFEDKKDIFLQGIEQYAKNLMFPINNIANQKLDINNLYNEFKEIIDALIKKHSLSKKAHEEILAMEHLDSDVAKIFESYELEASNSLMSSLMISGFMTKNLSEKAHTIVAMIDTLCHEIVYHKHKDMNYDYMIDLVLNTIVFVLEKQ